jgi:N-acetylglucosamine-6-phosphate deacetylase
MTGQIALINGRIALPHRLETGQALLVNGSIIVGLAPVDSLAADVTRLDVGGRLITPGLIDLHIHGALGHTFNEPTAAAFAAITAETARRGITAILATTSTAPIPDLAQSLDFTRCWLAQPQSGSQILGAHVEGPYFCLAQAGAQDPANIRSPNDGTVDQLLAYGDVIKMLTFAPELPGALALTARLVELGITPAAGHSCAADTQVLAALKLGLRHIIHMWSGQSTTVREGPWRKPGLLEAALTYTGFTAEIIADNKHLPPTLMKLAYKCLGADRLCAVSDATSGAGLPEGSRFRMGQMEYEVSEGVGMMLDRSSFAGSTTLLNQMLPILINVVDIPLVEAVRMVSLTPAAVIGVNDRKGSLEPGKDADLAIFNDDYTAWRVMVAGKWVGEP